MCGDLEVVCRITSFTFRSRFLGVIPLFLFCGRHFGPWEMYAYLSLGSHNTIGGLRSTALYKQVDLGFDKQISGFLTNEWRTESETGHGVFIQ